MFPGLSSRNLGLLNLMMSSEPNHQAHAQGWPWINATNPSGVSVDEYRLWYAGHGSDLGPSFTDCSLEEEMNKVKQIFTIKTPPHRVETREI